MRAVRKNGDDHNEEGTEYNENRNKIYINLKTLCTENNEITTWKENKMSTECNDMTTQ